MKANQLQSILSCSYVLLSFFWLCISFYFKIQDVRINRKRVRFSLDKPGVFSYLRPHLNSYFFDLFTEMAETSPLEMAVTKHVNSSDMPAWERMQYKVAYQF